MVNNRDKFIKDRVHNYLLVSTDWSSCKDISLSIIKDLYACLVNERRKNHDSLKFIHNDHDSKANDQCYEADS